MFKHKKAQALIAINTPLHRYYSSRMKKLQFSQSSLFEIGETLTLRIIIFREWRKFNSTSHFSWMKELHRFLQTRPWDVEGGQIFSKNLMWNRARQNLRVSLSAHTAASNTEHNISESTRTAEKNQSIQDLRASREGINSWWIFYLCIAYALQGQDISR